MYFVLRSLANFLRWLADRISMRSSGISSGNARPTRSAPRRGGRRSRPGPASPPARPYPADKDRCDKRSGLYSWIKRERRAGYVVRLRRAQALHDAFRERRFPRAQIARSAAPPLSAAVPPPAFHPARWSLLQIRCERSAISRIASGRNSNRSVAMNDFSPIAVSAQFARASMQVDGGEQARSRVDPGTARPGPRSFR